MTTKKLLTVILGGALFTISAAVLAFLKTFFVATIVAFTVISLLSIAYIFYSIKLLKKSNEMTVSNIIFAIVLPLSTIIIAAFLAFKASSISSSILTFISMELTMAADIIIVLKQNLGEKADEQKQNNIFNCFDIDCYIWRTPVNVFNNGK